MMQLTDDLFYLTDYQQQCPWNIAAYQDPSVVFLCHTVHGPRSPAALDQHKSGRSDDCQLWAVLSAVTALAALSESAYCPWSCVGCSGDPVEMAGRLCSVHSVVLGVNTWNGADSRRAHWSPVSGGHCHVRARGSTLLVLRRGKKKKTKLLSTNIIELWMAMYLCAQFYNDSRSLTSDHLITMSGIQQPRSISSVIMTTAYHQ